MLEEAAEECHEARAHLVLSGRNQERKEGNVSKFVRSKNAKQGGKEKCEIILLLTWLNNRTSGGSLAPIASIISSKWESTENKSLGTEKIRVPTILRYNRHPNSRNVSVESAQTCKILFLRIKGEILNQRRTLEFFDSYLGKNSVFRPPRLLERNRESIHQTTKNDIFRWDDFLHIIRNEWSLHLQKIRDVRRTLFLF